MAKINAGTITSIPSYYQYMTRYQRHLLLQHRAKKFHHIADRIIMDVPELQDMMRAVKEVSPSWYKNVKGRIVGEIMIRFIVFLCNPQHYAYRGDLIFYANWVHIQQFLQRIVKVMIEVHDFPNKHYPFKIQQKKLYHLSEIIADELIPYTKKVLLPHWEKIKNIPSKDKYI